MNEIYHSFKEKAGILGISTCFEDYEINTERKTRQLLENGTLVGETLAHFTRAGFDHYPLKVEFPVAFDVVMEAAKFISDDHVEMICRLNPNFPIWPEWEQEKFRKGVKAFYGRKRTIAKTFALNGLRGTPSFLIFDDQMNVLADYFGYLEKEHLLSEMERFYGQLSSVCQ